MQYERVRGGILWYPVTTLQCHVTCPPVINDHLKQELWTVKSNERHVINICLQSSVKDLHRQVQKEMTTDCSCLQSEQVMNPVYNILVVWLSDQDCLTSFAYWEGDTGVDTGDRSSYWPQSPWYNNMRAEEGHEQSNCNVSSDIDKFQEFQLSENTKSLEGWAGPGVIRDEWSAPVEWSVTMRGVTGAGWLTLPSPVIRARYNTDNNIVTLTLLRPCWVVHSTQDQIIPKTSERLT